MFGAYIALSLMSLMLSIVLFEAASISIKSIILPALIDVQTSQNSLFPGPCIVQLGDSGQFNALANTLAVVVLPTPLGPAKRYAWLVLDWSMEFLRVCVMCPWSTISLNVKGLHF